MNVIALTGRNMRAMADVAEQLIEHVTVNAMSVAVMLYVDDLDHVRAIRSNVDGWTEIWRIGADPSRPELDHVLDAQIDDSTAAVLAAQVLGQATRYAKYLTLFHQRRAVERHIPSLTLERQA